MYLCYCTSINILNFKGVHCEKNWCVCAAMPPSVYSPLHERFFEVYCAVACFLSCMFTSQEYSASNTVKNTLYNNIENTTLEYPIIGPVLLLIFGQLVLRFSLIRYYIALHKNCGPFINFGEFLHAVLLFPAVLLLDTPE